MLSTLLDNTDDKLQLWLDSDGFIQSEVRPTESITNGKPLHIGDVFKAFHHHHDISRLVNTVYVDQLISNKSNNSFYTIAIQAPDIEKQLYPVQVKKISNQHELQLTDLALDIARIGYWQVNLAAQECIWSKTTYSIHEVDPSTPISLEDGINFYTEESRPLITNAVNNCLATGEGWSLELTIQTATGRIRWVKAKGEAKYENGEMTTLLGTFQDIHEKKLLQIERENRLNNQLQSDEITKVGHWNWHIESEKIEWSDSLYQITGYSKDLAPPTLEEHKAFIHPNDQALFFSTVENSMAKQEPYKLDLRFIVNNSIKHVHAIGKPLFDEQQHHIGYFGTVQDISQLVEAKQELSNLNQRLSLALQAAELGVFEWDLISNTVYWDDKMYDLYGTENTGLQVNYDLWDRSIHPDDKEETINLLNSAITEGDVFDTSFRIITTSGDIKQIHAKGEVSYDDAGNPIKMFGLNWDTTKIAELEEKAFDLEGQLVAMDDITDGWFDWNLLTNEEYLSPKFKGMFGYNDNEMENHVDSWKKIIAQDDLKKLEENVLKHLGSNTEIPFHQIVNFTHKNGEQISVICRGKALKDRKGNYTRMIGTHTDVTQQILQAQQLQKSNQDLEQFAYIASHDLKAPLRVIDNTSKWLEEDLQDSLSGENLENLNLLRSRVKRMERLLDDLLIYSRAGREEFSSDKQISFQALYDEILMLVDAPKDFKFTLDCKNTDLCVPKMPMQQILLNLVSNAIKHHDKADGCIKVEIADTNDLLIVSVIDDGPGIAKQYQDKAFQMFQTLQPRDKVEGSGIGLAVVKKHLDAKGGSIKLISDEGQGCCFTFTLPKE